MSTHVTITAIRPHRSVRRADLIEALTAHGWMSRRADGGTKWILPQRPGAAPTEIYDGQPGGIGTVTMGPDVLATLASVPTAGEPQYGWPYEFGYHDIDAGRWFFLPDPD